MSRQAVIVIHGIGEQRPMDTLRRFVEAVLPEPRSNRVKFRSVPDRMSESFELRRLLAPQTASRPITDFFEYYWAYQIRGTKYRHVVAWLRTLLLRRPSNVPRRLLALWVLTWAMLISFAIASYLVAPLVVGPQETHPIRRILIWVTSALLLPVVSGFALGYLGDAARYLSPTPQNIAMRHRIRRDGVRLLRHLHSSGAYDRIVVVGHSLGSVIAYDILKYFWTEVHAQHGAPLKVDQSKLKNLESAAKALESGPTTAASLAQFRQEQLDLWHEQRRLGNPWLVSDLVTVGSPLAHAAMLLANTPAELLERQDEMELPMAPPNRNLERDFGYGVNYEVEGQKRTLKVLHNGAMFACTRWTNIYFPGDFVGGPLAPCFGSAVDDRRVHDSWMSFTPASHTRYWMQSGTEKPEALTALRHALDLDRKDWIAPQSPVNPDVPSL